MLMKTNSGVHIFTNKVLRLGVKLNMSIVDYIIMKISITMNSLDNFFRITDHFLCMYTLYCISYCISDILITYIFSVSYLTISYNRWITAETKN